MVILVQASQQWNPREIILPIDLPVLLSMRERRIKFLIHRIDKILQVNWLYTKDIRSLSPSSAVFVLAVLAGTPGHAWQVQLGTPGRYTCVLLLGAPLLTSCLPSRHGLFLLLCLHWGPPFQLGCPSFMVGKDSAVLLLVTVLIPHDYLITDNRNHWMNCYSSLQSLFLRKGKGLFCL